MADIPAEILQARSEYQLQHFVIGQHDTPEMRFYQCCLELVDMEYRLAVATLSARQTEAKIAERRAETKPDTADWIESELWELELDRQRQVAVGARREVEILRSFLEQMPQFTRAEIDRAQPDYWRARLTRQFELQRATGQLGWAQLDAMRQTGLLGVDQTQPVALPHPDMEG